MGLFLRVLVAAPPHDDFAPTVQPKQRLATRMGGVNEFSSAKLEIVDTIRSHTGVGDAGEFLFGHVDTDDPTGQPRQARTSGTRGSLA